MGDKFDPYCEALVVEQVTVWPDGLPEVPQDERQEIEKGLHGDAENAGELAYVRLHTGFCRKITVTAGDLERLKQS